MEENRKKLKSLLRQVSDNALQRLASEAHQPIRETTSETQVYNSIVEPIKRAKRSFTSIANSAFQGLGDTRHEIHAMDYKIIGKGTIEMNSDKDGFRELKKWLRNEGATTNFAINEILHQNDKSAYRFSSIEQTVKRQPSDLMVKEKYGYRWKDRMTVDPTRNRSLRIINEEKFE